MAVAIDATGTEQHVGSASTSMTYNGITVGSGSNRALVLLINIGAGSTLPTGVTAVWDNGGTNQSMTLITSLTQTNTSVICYVFGLRNPTAGLKNLLVSWTNANEAFAAAISFTGVDQTSNAAAFPNPNTVTNTTSNATCSLAITSASGNIPVATMVGSSTVASTSQTSIYVDNAAGIQSYAASRATTGASTVTFTWSLSPAASSGAAGCDVAAAAAAGNPFTPTDKQVVWDIRQAPIDLSAPFNPNLFKNPVPNNQFHYPQPFRIRRSPYDLSVALNPNLFKNPFPIFNSDQSSSKLVPDWAPAPPSPLNINLFTNPFPFNTYDFPKPWDIQQAKSEPNQALNINLFRNPFPVLNQFVPVAQPKPALLVDAPYNQNLYSVVVVAAPFVPIDFNHPFFPDALPQPASGLNPNIFTNPYPIFNGDGSSSKINPDWAPAPPPPLNVNLFANPYPVQNIFVATFDVANIPAPQQSYNPNLYSAAPAAVPFNQTYWPPASPVPSAPVEFFNLIPLDNSYPVQNVQAAIVPTRSFPLLDIPYNQNLYGIVSGPIPFNTYDYPQSKRSPKAPVDLSVSLNPGLFTNPIPALNLPGTQINAIRLTPPDQSVGFQIQLIPVVAVTLIQRTLTGVGL
jgi:hypothetical protein